MIDAARRLEALFQDVMREETVPARERTRTNSITWDSLMNLILATAIEQEFEIRLSPSDVIDMVSFEVALGLVNGKLSAKER